MKSLIYKIKNLPNRIIGTIKGTTTCFKVTHALSAVVTNNGVSTDLGVICERLLTKVAAAYIAANFAGAAASISAFKEHESGTGALAESNLDTIIQTAVAIAVPRVVSTNLTSSIVGGGPHYKYVTVATIVYDVGSHSITEHGIFSADSTLLDRSVFAAIPVNAGDSITFTYTLQVNAE